MSMRMVRWNINMKNEDNNMVEDTNKQESVCCGAKEVIYSNDAYRVEKITLPISEDKSVAVYGVYSNDYGVLEVETTILAKALNSADELETAVNTFFQGKAFDNIGSSSDSVIETA